MLSVSQSLVLYEDERRAVVNKPGDRPYEVFAAEFFPALFALNMAACVTRQNREPHCVHRLDKLTSGCLVVGFTSRERRRLHKMFERRTIDKSYIAVVAGEVTYRGRFIETPLHYDKAANVSTPHAEGKYALTEISVLASSPSASVLWLKPHTGRTHQLRVHCSSLGHPILGDWKYGTAEPPLHLHAHRISFPNEVGQMINVQAPLPPHMEDAIKQQWGRQLLRKLEGVK